MGRGKDDSKMIREMQNVNAQIFPGADWNNPGTTGISQ